jgi:hypothetical protein
MGPSALRLHTGASGSPTRSGVVAPPRRRARPLPVRGGSGLPRLCQESVRRLETEPGSIERVGLSKRDGSESIVGRRANHLADEIQGLSSVPLFPLLVAYDPVNPKGTPGHRSPIQSPWFAEPIERSGHSPPAEPYRPASSLPTQKMTWGPVRLVGRKSG